MTEIQDKVLQEAKGWIGTPYHHGASLKGIGCDCAGFVLGVYRNVGVANDLVLPPYSPQTMLHSFDESYAGYLLQYMNEIPETELQGGDIVLYKSGRSYSHSAIVVVWPQAIIHSVNGLGVIFTHGITDSIIQGRPRRCFTRRNR